MRSLVCGASVLPAADIVLLQETIVSGDSAHVPMTPELAQEFADDTAPQCRSVWTGHCGIIFSPTMNAYDVEAHSLLDGRLIVAALTNAVCTTIIGCVYAPAQPTPRASFFSKMHHLLEQHDHLERLILAGDWNIAPNTADPHDFLGGRPMKNGGGHASWRAMADSSALNLVELLGARKPARDFGDLTWSGLGNDGRRIRRRLDWFAVSRSIVDDFDVNGITTIPVWFSVPNTNSDIDQARIPGTDHATITAVFRPTRQQRPNRPSRIPTMSWYTARRYPAESGFLDKVVTAVDECYHELSTTRRSDEQIQERFDELHNGIQSTYVVHSKTVKRLSHRETAVEVQAMRDLYAKHADPSEWSTIDHAMQTAQDSVRHAIEHAAREADLQTAVETSHNHAHHRHIRNAQSGPSKQTSFQSQRVYVPTPDEHNLENLYDAELRHRLQCGPGWTPAKGLAADIESGRVARVSTTEYTDDEDLMLENSRLFYAALYRQRRIHVTCQDMLIDAIPQAARFSMDEIERLGATPSVADIVEAINDQNTARSCDPHGFVAELYRHCAEKWARLMAIVFAACFRLRRVTAMMRNGYIVLLYKKGDERDLGNWRPVTKVPRALSILESVFKLRLYPLMGRITAYDQCSAAPGRDMMHAIVPVLDAIDFAASPNSPAIQELSSVVDALHAVLLDQIKGFDRADRGLMMRLLALYCGLQIPCRDDPNVDYDQVQADISTIDFLVWMQIVVGDAPLGYPHTRAVLVNGRLSRILELHSGDPQGAILAALLFNCSTVEALGALLKRAGLQGLKVRNDEGEIVNFCMSRFADDLVLILDTASVHPALDAIDVYSCGSGGAANLSKTLGMTLTPHTAPATPGPGGGYLGDTPTYIPPGTQGQTPRNRLRWLRPSESVGRVLGVNAGPAASPKDDWCEVEGAFFTQLRMWSRHRLSRDGRIYVIGTHIFSRTWFLGRYRPPPPQVQRRMDAAAVKYYWKGRVGEGGPGDELRAFKVGPRASRHSLTMSRPHGGVAWFRTEHIFTAIHAGMIVQWMHPVGANAEVEEQRWQTTGRTVITQVLGHMAGLVVHPDIKQAVRRAHFIPAHWAAYLRAWSDVRIHYRVEAPTTFEEVMSMTLYDNSEFTYRGQPLPAHEWQPAADAGVTTIKDLWHEAAGRMRTHAELRILPARVDILRRSLPRRWACLLQAGRTAIGSGEWALHNGPIGGARTYQGYALVRTTDDANRMQSTVIVTVFTRADTRGWVNHSTTAVRRANLHRATVEHLPKQVRGRDTWTLVGLTELVFASSRTRMRLATGSCGWLADYTTRTGCRCLSGTSKPTAELRAASKLLECRADPRLTFLTIRKAAWAPEVRDFIWDVRAGALPTGRGAGLPSSRCVVCGDVVDDIRHVLQCPCLRELREWTADVICAMELPQISFHKLVAQGLPSGGGVADAIRSAAATAARKHRAYVLVNHRAMPRRHICSIVNTAKRVMRDHIGMDRLFAFGSMERRPGDGTAYVSRPTNRAEFIAQWAPMCDMQTYTDWRHTRHPIRYKLLLRPHEMTTDVADPTPHLGD